MTEAPTHCMDCGTPKEEVLRQNLTRGRCRNCYKRHVYALKKEGAFQAIEAAPPMERLFSRGVPGRNGCIIWTGSMNSVTGYGHFHLDGVDGYAHRAAYILVKGEIPDGYVIDHACHNRDPDCTGGTFCIHHRCINPHHLDAVTQRENRIRSPHTKNSANGQKTHCKQGHEFTPENTRIVSTTGARHCVTCNRRRQREYMERRRASQQAA